MKALWRASALALLGCLLCLPALADTQTYDDHDTHYTVSTFEADFPAEVSQALQAPGASLGEPVRGALVESVWTEPKDVRESADPKIRSYAKTMLQANNFAVALCVLRREDTQWAVGLRRDAEGAWRTTLLSDRVVLPGRAYMLTLEPEYADWRHPLFVFGYPRQDGGSDAYALSSSSQNGAWSVCWYEKRLADGGGLHIESGDPRGFYQLWDLPYTEDFYLRMREYTYYEKQYLSFGALLRGASAQCSGGWLRVRVGLAEGYVSTRYSVPAEQYAVSLLDLVARPLPLGKLLRDCDLLQGPQSNAAVQAALSQGAECQVMGVTDDGWLHVTLSPWGDAMQPSATDGYLPADAVEVSGRGADA